MNATLRYWEYYGMQSTFDLLFEKSSKGNKFKDLYEIIISRENILLAYRIIKSNKGSNTKGTDDLTIADYETKSENEFVEFIQNHLIDYKPKSVRRVLIPKPNGDKRPLGIPAMIDRLIQQMFKQVLEPIAEANFFKHSYGFRPQRSTHHAMSRCQTLINKVNLHYVVDIDIKGFFDNVNHTMLNKQLWNMGIRDKRVTAIISKMLKAPIKGVGTPSKGTPQGGILSPLLSNIVLNDLDHWVSDQWETFESKHTYNKSSNRNAELKKTKLKEGYIVRYADDFKIFARDYKTACKWYHAVRLYLKERLKLDISPEKSKVVNLRENSSDFLGFTLKTSKKGRKLIAHTYVQDKKIKQIKIQAKQHIKAISKEPSIPNVMKLNQFILGVHNYFKFATHVSVCFHRIAYDLHRYMHNRLKRAGFRWGKPISPSPTYKRFYRLTYSTFGKNGYYIYPLADIKWQINLSYPNGLTPYTEKGREKIHKMLPKEIINNIQHLMTSNIPNRSIEYMDNRISKYSMTKGKCEITSEFLTYDLVHCHHFTPVSLGGTDKFGNLKIVHKDIHKLIHAVKDITIVKYLGRFNLNDKQMVKLNKYRKACNLNSIT